MALTALAMEGCVTGTATYSPSAGPAKTTSMSALPTIAPDDTVSDPGQATPTGAPAEPERALTEDDVRTERYYKSHRAA